MTDHKQGGLCRLPLTPASLKKKIEKDEERIRETRAQLLADISDISKRVEMFANDVICDMEWNTQAAAMLSGKEAAQGSREEKTYGNE